MNINENVKKMIKIRQKMINLMCITNPGTGSWTKNGLLWSQTIMDHSCSMNELVFGQIYQNNHNFVSMTTVYF